MPNYEVHKVSALPETFDANAIYIVEDADEDFLQLYVSSDDGLSVRRGVIKADLPSNAVTLNVQSGVYTAILADADPDVEVIMDDASPNTFRVPAHTSVAFPTGAVINVTRVGDGPTTVDCESGVTLNGVLDGSAEIISQYQGVSFMQLDTDVWLVSGDVGAFS